MKAKEKYEKSTAYLSIKIVQVWIIKYLELWKYPKLWDILHRIFAFDNVLIMPDRVHNRFLRSVFAVMVQGGMTKPRCTTFLLHPCRSMLVQSHQS